LRVRKNNKFKIVQISDTHIVIDVGICKNTIDIYKNYLSESETDLLTIKFIEKILNIEKLDFVILTENQLYYNISDS